jgi:hypothetical protein
MFSWGKYEKPFAAPAGIGVATRAVKSDDIQGVLMSKRIAAIVLALTFVSLAIAPETLAQRSRRDCNRSANTRSYSSYPYSGVAGRRYYAEPYYRGGAGTGYYGQSSYRNYRDYRGRNSTRDAILTVAAPAAVGAGVGAIVAGGKGAGVGALIGGGGGALFYLLNHHGRR